MRRIGLFVLAAGCAFAVSAAAQQSYYVQSITTPLLAKPAMNAEVLARLERGTELKDAIPQGRWIKVQYAGREAWVSALTTTTTPPRTLAEAPAGAEPVEEQPRTKLRSRASAQPAIVAGVKGLVYEERARASSGERVDFTALASVEAIAVTPVELQVFIAEGGKR